MSRPAKLYGAVQKEKQKAITEKTTENTFHRTCAVKRQNKRPDTEMDFCIYDIGQNNAPKLAKHELYILCA